MVLIPIDKGVLIPLELTAASSAVEAGIYKKNSQDRNLLLGKTLLISNEEMDCIMKLVKPVKDYW